MILLGETRVCKTHPKLPVCFVGYQTIKSVSGFNFITPTFKAVAQNDIPIQNIKLSGDNVSDYTDNLQILDEGGATSEYYIWQDTAEGMGWVLEGEDDASTRTIKKGEVVLISTDNEDVDVTFAGEVSTKEEIFTSVSGFNFVGNSNPVAISIQDVVISGDSVSDYTDNLQILDEGGATSEYYIWQDTAEGMGWVLEGEDDASDRVIKPGEGFLVSTDNDGVVITIKGLNL